jgi:NAD-dependent dihydropyrimidine dehydrogenase PreA subunit
VTGNFTLTVRRLKEVLAERDAWVLVANSKGINVWCAAGGGHLTHHDVIAAIRASRIGDHVRHRSLVLPQLSATGIERRKITDATGWTAKWGPARLEDLREFLDRGCRVEKEHRFMRFPLWERLEMALVWALPMAAIALVISGLVVGWRTGLIAGGVTLLMVSALFAGLPWLKVTGRLRWLTFGGVAVAGVVIGYGALALSGETGGTSVVALGIVAVAGMLLLSIDLTGTTPWYPSTINSFRNDFSVEALEERCTGAAECVQVCPRDVLRVNGRRRRVEIVRPESCIRCGACVVQCPEDVLRFHFPDGRVVEPATVRSTRLNLLGRRSITLGANRRSASADR